MKADGVFSAACSKARSFSWQRERMARLTFGTKIRGSVSVTLASLPNSTFQAFRALGRFGRACLRAQSKYSTQKEPASVPRSKSRNKAYKNRIFRKLVKTVALGDKKDFSRKQNHKNNHLYE